MGMLNSLGENVLHGNVEPLRRKHKYMYMGKLNSLEDLFVCLIGA